MSVSTKPPADFAQACLLAAPLDFRTLDAPVIHSRTSELGSFDILPLKAATHSTSLQSVVELVEPMSAGDFDFGHLYHLISTAKYEDLPGPLSVSFGNAMKFKMQLVGQQSSDGQWVFLKHFIFEDKIHARLLKTSLGGDLHVINYGTNFRSGLKGFQYLLEHLGQCVMWFQTQMKEPKTKTKETSDLQKGFDFIRSSGPRSNMHNRQTEWTEVEMHKEGSPIFGWSAGLVKESLRGYANSNVFADSTSNFFVTLRDLQGWFLHDVLVPLLPTMKSKTLVMMGLAEKGKTPAAQALALAISEYWILVDDMAWDVKPSFRLCSSLDQLRGEPGKKHVPDILDDPDMNVVPMPKLKAFLDASLEESFTVERWTTSKFVRNQLRILCDNKIDEDGDKWISPGHGTIPHEVFLDIIAPAFPEKSSSQDKMALLKRSRWVVNTNRACYVRKAGTGANPVPCTQYEGGIMDFIADSGKAILDRMKNGDKRPPSDWLENRQWSHDFVSLVLEKGRTPERTTVIIEQGLFDKTKRRVERKPDLPFSGRVVVDLESTDLVAPADGTEHPASRPTKPAPAPWTPVPVKKEPGVFASLSTASGSATIDLDTPSPRPAQAKRRRVHGDGPASEDGDGLPRVGEAPEDE